MVPRRRDEQGGPGGRAASYRGCSPPPASEPGGRGYGRRAPAPRPFRHKERGVSDDSRASTVQCGYRTLIG
jgi:hypothetical protein